MSSGFIYVVGIGPGGQEHLSPRAKTAIKGADAVVGYSTYIVQLGELIADKRVIVSGMTRETERVAAALDGARRGERIAVVSGGDAGIYGMAGPVLERLRPDEDIGVEVIPGITALSACAALLGAPIMHDFAVVSLSDLLTDRAVIERRVRLAAEADFVIVFYNPRSKSRTEPWEMAREIVARYRPPETIVGVARNAARDNQVVKIMDLKSMADLSGIDMATTVIIGNSQTYRKACGGREYMITPRGYY